MLVSGARQALLSRLQKINYHGKWRIFSIYRKLNSLTVLTAISRRLSEKLCTRQSRKVIWDMINTLFLTVAVKPTFVAFLYHSQTYVQASRAIVSNFFEKQWTQSHPQHLSGLSRALFPTTFLEAEYMK